MTYGCDNGHRFNEMPNDATCVSCGGFLYVIPGTEPFESPMIMLEDVSLVLNNQPRCPAVLLLDTSGSMSEEGKIDRVNQGVRLLLEEMRKDRLASMRVELAIVTFANEATVVQEFATVDQIVGKDFTAHGQTKMGAAIHKALDLISARRRQYKKHNTECYKPMLFLLTDGWPTDNKILVQQAAARVRKAIKEDEKDKVLFFPIGVGERVDMSFLNQLSIRGAIRMEETKLIELFKWIKDSLSSVSKSNTDDDVEMLPVDTFATP